MMPLILCCAAVCSSSFAMQFMGGGLGGGGLNNLFKPNTIQQAGQADECKIKCGGPAGCEKGRADHAAGTIPPKERIFGHGAQASRPPPYQQRLKKSLVKPVAQFNFLSPL